MMTTLIQVSEREHKLPEIQVLRAVAALLVASVHTVNVARNIGVSRFNLGIKLPGSAGVDIFFVISGFIMVLSSDKLFGSTCATSKFLFRRLVRIVPLYWLVTLLVVMISIVQHKAIPSVYLVVTSLLFIPLDTRGLNDGFSFPILELGWTLNFEMLFYLIFSIMINFRRKLCVTSTLSMLVLQVIIGQTFSQLPGIIYFWTRSIILEFGFGMLVAILYLNIGQKYVSKMSQPLLIGFGIAGIFGDIYHLGSFPLTPNDFRRVLGWGIPSAALLSGVVIRPIPLHGWLTRILKHLGDASYSLYLLHPLVINVAMRILSPHLVRFAAAQQLFVALVIPIICVVALVSYRLVERPMTMAVTSLLRRMGAPIGSVPRMPPSRMFTS